MERGQYRNRQWRRKPRRPANRVWRRPAANWGGLPREL